MWNLRRAATWLKLASMSSVPNLWLVLQFVQTITAWHVDPGLRSLHYLWPKHTVFITWPKIWHPIYGCCGWYSCPKRNLWRAFVDALINKDEKKYLVLFLLLKKLPKSKLYTGEALDLTRPHPRLFPIGDKKMDTHKYFTKKRPRLFPIGDDWMDTHKYFTKKAGKIFRVKWGP